MALCRYLPFARPSGHIPPAGINIAAAHCGATPICAAQHCQSPAVPRIAPRKLPAIARLTGDGVVTVAVLPNGWTELVALVAAFLMAPLTTRRCTVPERSAPGASRTRDLPLRRSRHLALRRARLQADRLVACRRVIVTPADHCQLGKLRYLGSQLLSSGCVDTRQATETPPARGALSDRNALVDTASAADKHRDPRPVYPGTRTLGLWPERVQRLRRSRAGPEDHFCEASEK